jgi:hypothetical protein
MHMYIVSLKQHLAPSAAARECTVPGKLLLLPPFPGVVHSLNHGVQPRQGLGLVRCSVA